MNQKTITRNLLRSRWITSLQCAQRGGCLSLAQRVSEWKREGAKILDRWEVTKSGARVKAYYWPE